MQRTPAARRKGEPRYQLFATWLLLIVVTVLAYLPALNGGILWDDDRHLTPPELQSLHGLGRIWFEFGATQQYYPLLHTAFWLEHRLWGDRLLEYHLVSILFHAISACLVVLILKRLRVLGAVLAGFLFALHPVCVEAVAWISEQKSTLSGVCYLVAAWCYLSFDENRRRSSYLLATGVFICALLSKTVTGTLPAALLLIFWWRRGKIEWVRDGAPLIPWIVLSASAGAVTAWVERRFIGATGPAFDLTAIERCLIAGRAVWFYLGKLIWPYPLTFIYPRWKVQPSVWWQYAFPLAVLAFVGVLIWLARTRGWRGPLVALLFFAGTLLPALGFFNVYPFLYSFVADHFQYLASLGVVVLAASGLASYLRGTALAVTATAVVALLGVLTWRQAGIYQDSQTLYQATLAQNPDCWLAHNNLGAELLSSPGRLEEAIAHFESALRLEPNYPQAYNNLGMALSRLPNRSEDAIRNFEQAVRLQPNYAQAQNNLGLALSRDPDRTTDAISHFQTALRIDPNYAQAHNNFGSTLAHVPGETVAAITEFKTAIQLQPDFAEAHYNLANALSDLPGRRDDAIAEYTETLRLQPDNALAHNNLGTVLAQTAGRLANAIAEYQNAIRIAPGFADAHYNLGVAFSQSGRLQDAISEFDRALAIDPNLNSARRMKARLQPSPLPTHS